jgi:hypothetical protein
MGESRLAGSKSGFGEPADLPFFLSTFDFLPSSLSAALAAAAYGGTLVAWVKWAGGGEKGV